MTEMYIQVEDAILAAQEGADVWDGGCNPERDKHIRLAISAKPTYTPAEIMAGMWVPVTPETMPEDGDDIWVYIDAGEESRVAPANYYKGIWWDAVMNAAAKDITYWMPLPQPPKEATP